MSEAQKSPAQSSAPTSRKKTLTLLIGALAVVAVGYGAWWAIFDSHYEDTDDAYVSGNIVQISPQVSGTVVAIRADDTDYVKAGQELVTLDRADAQVALDQAEAQLAQTVREVRTLYANNSTLNSTIATREADVARAKLDVARAQEDYDRRKPLLASGAVGSEEVKHIEDQIASAKSALAAAQSGADTARQQLLSNQVLTDGAAVDQHPNVLRAAAHVRETYLAVARTSVPAPSAGQVAKRNVQLGQRVQPGTPLMAIISLDHLWVDANFKEVQLRKMRIGQPVTLKADLYGGRTEYHGKIAGLSAGTGSAFSLLPAQNATGNWIKVVQRLPVRIALDAEELKQHPLRVGLSMMATVDVANQDGTQVNSAINPASSTETDAFNAQSAKADEIVQRIIAANLGQHAAPRKS